MQSATLEPRSAARSAEPSIKQIDALLSGATPHFAQQLKARVRALVGGLPADSDVRRYGEVQMQMLDRLSVGTTRAPRGVGEPALGNPAWATLPSHPAADTIA